MKSIMIKFIFLMIPAAMLLSGCARTVELQPIVASRFIDVYINQDCLPTTLAKGGIIDTLWLYPGDRVVITNTRDKEITINFPAGMFDQDKVLIESGKRVILEVQKISPETGAFSIVGETSGICPDGAPKVKIGDDP